jgi:PhnB protein
MTTVTTYLFFNGTCQQAMEFYHSCFGGGLTLIKAGDSPARDQIPPAMHDKVINARLKSSSIDISASDWLRFDRTPIRGNMACLYLNSETPEELKGFFDRLSDGADVTDPLRELFFGTYGALNDKFGVRWMFRADTTKV